jgi:hypothetical protein
MARATYTLELELSYNTWTDITADWRAADPLIIERGIEPGDRVAGVGRMELLLHNPDGRYSPGHANVEAGFTTGIGARLKADDGASTFTLFYGRVSLIAPGSKHITRLVAEDDIAGLRRTPIGAFPLITNAAPRDLANRLITRSFVPPGLFAYWRLEHPVAGRLGQTTTLPGDLTGKALDVGQSVFTRAGDTWPADRSALACMIDLCASEGGWFFIRADGTPVFQDRHVRPKKISADVSVSGGLAGLQADTNEGRLANRIEVTAYPRTAGVAVATLWTLNHPIRLMPGKPQRALARYIDPDQPAASVGAETVISPQEGIDYTATADLHGFGADRTPYLQVNIEAGGRASRLILTSRNPDPNAPIYVQTLQVRGVPLRAYEPVTISLEDGPSLLAHDRHRLFVDMPLQDDPRVADDMAHLLLANRKDPHPWPVITIEGAASAALLTQALAREVGDRISLTDASTGLTGYGCFIEHIRHEIARGGASHRATWRTSPADIETYWVLGSVPQASLGQKSLLGY